MKNPSNPFLATTLAAAALASHAPAATLYHDGAGGVWGSTASWSTADAAATPDPAAVPGAADDTVFNISTANANQTLAFNNSSSSAKSILFRSTGTVTFRSQSGATRTLNLAAGGLTVNSGAGAVTLGNTANDAFVVSLSANQTWTNNSGSLVSTPNKDATAGVNLNNRILTLDGSGNFTFNGTMRGNTGGGIIKNGTGTVILNNINNNFTGALTINDGTVAVAGGSSIVDSVAVSLADATGAIFRLDASETIGSLAGGGSTGGNVNLQGNTLTVGDANTNTTFAGILSGTGGLTKQGTGALALSGPNTYQGATTVSAGSLVFQNTAAKPSLSAVSVAAGATLGLGVGTAPDYYTDAEIDALFANTLPGISMDPASNVGVDTTAGNYTCTSNLAAGAKGLTKLGANTLTLLGTNAYAGPTSINAGALLISAANHLGDATQATNSINLGAATLRSSANSYDLGTNRSIALTGAATIQVDADALTVSGTVTGANSLTKSGAGTLVLSGPNSYSGETIISGGTLRVDSASGLGATSRVRFTSGATVLDNNTGGPLTIAGLASNINSSAQQITGGELLVTGLAENVQNTGFGGWTFNNTKTTLAGGLKLSTDNNRNFWINGSAEIIVSGNVVQAGTNSTLQYSGSGSGSLTLSGSANTHSGGVTLNSGTLNVNNPTAFGATAGTFTIGYAILDNTSASAITIANNNPVAINGDFTFIGTRDLHLGNGAVSLGAAAGTTRAINVEAGNLTLGGVISNGATATGLIKDGDGTLTLAAANAYTGDTTVNSGSLRLGDGTANSNLADTSVVTVASGATLNLNYLVGNTDTVKELWLGGVQKAAGVYSSSDPSGLITGSGTLTVTTGPGSSPYDTWASSPPYNLSGPNAAFDFDNDNDGLANGLEWIFGGDPTQNDNPSILPVVTGSATSGLTLVFNRATASLPPASTLVVDFDGDLDATWAKSVTVGAANSGPDANGVTVAVDSPTAGKVTVVIPASNAVAGKLFARFRASNP
jgi:autotransporter-associated beta strand protein